MSKVTDFTACNKFFIFILRFTLVRLRCVAIFRSFYFQKIHWAFSSSRKVLIFILHCSVLVALYYIICRRVISATTLAACQYIARMVCDRLLYYDFLSK